MPKCRFFTIYKKYAGILVYLRLYYCSLSKISLKNIQESNTMKDLLFSVFPNENFVDLGLYQFGWERCAPSHSFGPAARTHFLFHYVISGTGTLYADDSSGVTQTYQIKSGQGFMIFPNQITTYIADKNLLGNIPGWNLTDCV